MRKLWVILGFLLIFLATVLGGVLLAGRYLQSPEFKALVLSTLGEAMGSDVSLQEMDISVLNGISLRGVGIANPAGFPGDFFGAEQVVLRHRIWPLLSERVEIDRLAIERPHLTLVQSRDQKWNVELLQANWSRPPGGVSQASQGPLDIALSRFEIDHGELVMHGSEGGVLARGQDISLDSSVSFVEEKLGGGGELNLETLEIGETLFLNNLVATFGLRCCSNPLQRSWRGATFRAG